MPSYTPDQYAAINAAAELAAQNALDAAGGNSDKVASPKAAWGFINDQVYVLEAWAVHCRKTGAELDYIQHGDVQVLQVKLGAAYRDTNEIISAKGDRAAFEAAQTWLYGEEDRRPW